MPFLITHVGLTSPLVLTSHLSSQLTPQPQTTTRSPVKLPRLPLIRIKLSDSHAQPLLSVCVEQTDTTAPPLHTHHHRIISQPHPTHSPTHTPTHTPQSTPAHPTHHTPPHTTTTTHARRGAPGGGPGVGGEPIRSLRSVGSGSSAGGRWVGWRGVGSVLYSCIQVGGVRFANSPSTDWWRCTGFDSRQLLAVLIYLPPFRSAYLPSV